MLTITLDHTKIQTSSSGAVAQLGARVNGIHEVAGSIPASSTNLTAGEGHAAIGQKLFAPELPEFIDCGSVLYL
jgi:hypothetical protein